MKLVTILLTLPILGLAGGQQFKHYVDENDKIQAAMEGKAPPPFTASEWLNSKPLIWKKLKGKVVLIDMWAFW